MANRITFTSRSLNTGGNINIKNNGNISMPNIGSTTVANTPIVQPVGGVKPEVKVNTPSKTANANPLIISNAGILNVLNISASTWAKELPKEDPEEKWLSQFVPQDKLNMPICPAQNAAENLLFEDPSNASIKYFLPNYKVAEQPTTNGRQRRVKLEQFSTDPNLAGKLTVFLERYPHDSIKNQNVNAKVIKHEIQVALSFQVSGGTKSLVFQDITEHPDGTIKAVLNIATLDEKDQVFLALSTETYKANLSIIKTAWVAYPVFTQLNVNDLNPETHKPILRFTGQEDYTAGGKTFTRAKLSIINRPIYADALFSPAADLPPCGENKSASRTWCNIYSGEGNRIYGFCALNKNDQLENLWFAFPKGAPSSNVCYIELLDRRTNKSFVSKKVAITGNPASGKPLYRVSNETFEEKLPFFFSLTIASNANIYQGVVGGSTHQTGFTLHSVVWKTIRYYYLHDEANPKRFNALPDSFILARQEGIKNYPWMRIDFKQKDEASETKVDLSFTLKGYLDPKRLQAANTELLAKAKSIDPSIEELEFTSWSMDASKLKCALFLPDGSGGNTTVERNNAIFDLNSRKIEDVISDLSIEQFQQAFVAILSNDKTGKTLTGHVKVDLENLGITIPVSIRVEDTSGELFLISTEFVPNSTTVKIILHNTTESTIEITKINNIDIKNENQWLSGSPQGLTFPIQVPSSGILPITVTTDKPLVNDPSLDVMFDWDLDIKLDTEDDRTKVFDAMVNPAVFSTYKQPIKVIKFADLIPANSPIRTLKINFKYQENGKSDSILFENNGQREDLIFKVPLQSMRDYAVGKPVDGQYFYQVVASTLKNSAEGEWRKNTSDLIITTDMIPAVADQT